MSSGALEIAQIRRVRAAQRTVAYLSTATLQHVRVSKAQLSISAHVTPAVAREIVHQRHVDHQMGFTCKIDILKLQVALLFSTAGPEVTVRRREVKPPRLKTFSSDDKMCSCASLMDPLSSCLKPEKRILSKYTLTFVACLASAGPDQVAEQISRGGQKWWQRRRVAVLQNCSLRRDGQDLGRWWWWAQPSRIARRWDRGQLTAPSFRHSNLPPCLCRFTSLKNTRQRTKGGQVH